MYLVSVQINIFSTLSLPSRAVWSFVWLQIHEKLLYSEAVLSIVSNANRIFRYTQKKEKQIFLSESSFRLLSKWANERKCLLYEGGTNEPSGITLSLSWLFSLLLCDVKKVLFMIKLEFRGGETNKIRIKPRCESVKHKNVLLLLVNSFQRMRQN